MENENTVIIPLEDAVIMESKKQGEETLRLAIEANGKQVKFRFPRWGKLDAWMKDMYKLMLVLGSTVGDIEVNNIADFDLNKFSDWSALVALSLRYKKVQKHAEKMFFKYLNPKIKNVIFIRRWCRKNLGIDAIHQMLIAILFIEDWIEKKNKSSLMRMLQKETAQQSTPASMKNSGGQQNKSIELVHSKSVSF